MVYDADSRTADVIIRPSGGIVRVSEGDLHTNHTPHPAEVNGAKAVLDQHASVQRSKHPR